MRAAVSPCAALTDEPCVLQQLAQHGDPIPTAFNLSIGIKHESELPRKPERTERETCHNTGGERQDTEQHFQLPSKTKPAAAGAEDQQCAVAEERKAQIGQARDGCAESELHRKADKGGENAPAAPPAQRIEQQGEHQREQQRQAAQEKPC